MRHGTATPPDRSAVPWSPPVPLWLVAVGSAVLVAPIAYAAHRLGRPPVAVAAVELSWVVASVVAQEQVQTALGGGRLDNRVLVRMVIAASCFTVFLAGLGASFLLPLAAVVVGVPQISWSGPASWRTCAAVFAGATALGQVAVVAGLLGSVVRPGLSVVLAVVGTSGATATLAWSGVATAHREEQTRQLHHLARTDPLTGVLNRAAVLAEVGRRLDAAGLHVPPQDRVGVLYCDLVGFKQVNDSLGHRAGDAVLREVARRLSAALPTGAAVGRLGGDEFLVVVGPGADDGHVAVAADVEAAVTRPVDVDGRDVVVGVSIGTASAGAGEAADDLVSRADAAMYGARRGAPGGPSGAGGAVVADLADRAASAERAAGPGWPGWPH